MGAVDNVPEKSLARGIWDFPLHPLLRNVIGRLFACAFDFLTVLMYFMCKVHAAPKITEPMSKARVQEMAGKLRDLEANGQSFDPVGLYALFDALPVVRSAEMVGMHYKGVIVHHGGLLSLVDKTLVRLGLLFGWRWGKHYATHYVGHPLVIRARNLCI